MHYVFVDEKYLEDGEHKTIIVAAWAVNQNTLNNNLEQLSLPERAPFLQRVEAAFKILNAVAFIGRAQLPKSVFRNGETDGCDDIPAMARTDTVWSLATAFAVGRLLLDVAQSGQLMDVADLHFDPKSLKEAHLVAWEKTLRSLLVQEARRFASQAGLRSLEDIRIRHIRFVEKAKNSDPDKFQQGVALADSLCSWSEEIFNSNLSRISHADMSDVVERTVSQWDGVPFYR
ncbi:MAG TPA: hypothetical protein VNB54_00970 [Alphaproteobacteria bacterium]|nr:hypothetical protein [Alphaproteobacteria bacterium]